MKNQKEAALYILSETLSPIFPSLTLTRRILLKLAAGTVAGIFAAPKTLFGAEQRISEITTVVNDANFNAEVYRHSGKAIVLFYANFDDYSPKIFPLFRELVGGYNNKVKFCSYELDESYNPKINSGFKEKWAELKSKYGVSLLPTINLYAGGALNDYIRGVPNNKVPEEAMKKYIIKWILDH